MNKKNSVNRKTRLHWLHAGYSWLQLVTTGYKLFYKGPTYKKQKTITL
nr:MAG TPA: hypothetical protein [Caudoviricetes sp.]